MSEVSLIDLLHQYICITRNDVLLGTGDDCAIVRVPLGFQLAVSTDTLIAGRHFPLDTPVHAIGYKSLAVNLSDLAAMGATPAWVSLALSLPEDIQENLSGVNNLKDFIAGFASGFAELAKQYHVQLIGGDITQGELSITVTVMGLLPQGQALKRSGARSGDDIYISTEQGMGLGAANFELTYAEAQKRPNLDYPNPRVLLGQKLLGLASACIDVSDGLLADLSHILKASTMGAQLFEANLPIAKNIIQAGLSHIEGLKMALCAGDEYELCFTAGPEQSEAIEEIAKQLGLELTKFGTITVNTHLDLYKHNGDRYDLSSFGEHGYNHFP